jgi:hypothetical protein
MSDLSGGISKNVLEELLECPVCVSIPKNSNYNQCRNGHFECQDCFAKLTTCPICRWYLIIICLSLSSKTILILERTIEIILNLPLNESGSTVHKAMEPKFSFSWKF